MLDDSDEAVFDLKVHRRARGYVLGESTGGFDGEVLAAVGYMLVVVVGEAAVYGLLIDLRKRWVWVEVHALQLEDIVLGVLAELQRALARNFEGIVVGRYIDRAAEDARPSTDRGGEEGGREECEELHVADASVATVVGCLGVDTVGSSGESGGGR